MGRLPYLENLAWGRSIWSPPWESGWDTLTSTNTTGSSRPIELLDGQYPEDIQQYDERNRPINPRSQQMGRELRRAANDVLCVFGVVERAEETDDEIDHQIVRAEEEILVPTTLASIIISSLSETWISNVMCRLLALPPKAEDTLAYTVAEDYTLFGPWMFGFAGAPANLLERVCQPPLLAPATCYFIFRMILAKISNLRTRQKLIALTTNVSFGLHIFYEFVDFPLRFHGLVHSLGLISTSKMFPNINDFNPFNPVFPLRFEMSCVPMWLYFYKGAVRRVVHTHLLHRIVRPLILEMFQYTGEEEESYTPATAEMPIPVDVEQNAHRPEERTAGHALETLANADLPVGSFELNLENFATVNQPVNTPAPDLPPMGLILDFGPLSTDGISHQAEPSSQTPDNTQANTQQDPPASQSSARVNPPSASSNSPIDSNPEEVNHSIRITEVESADGPMPQLNIEYYETIPPPTHRVRRRRGARTRRETPLTLLPQKRLASIVTSSICSMGLLSIDAWLLPQVVRWWVHTHGMPSGPIGRSERFLRFLDPAPERMSIKAVASLVGKVVVCEAIREMVMLGLWVVETRLVIVAGKRWFEWGGRGHVREDEDID
ncbi:hypothetical protein BT63DRAFT_264057 [Microthyrium microscopicum]|uniref:Uncharacterized protein n=1 Tax=Microthyrium microscopicum TaxID=703497 RepID=A0A6A6UBL3_9PEZI|nr:hypothetical protein BT63DRAFT_264057 [Microthyrium microscopicum]